MNTFEGRAKSFRAKKIPLSTAVFTVSVLLLFIAWQNINFKGYRNLPPQSASAQQNDCPPPAMLHYNMNNYKYAHPLLLSDQLNENDTLDSKLIILKTGISKIIEQKKQSGEIITTSVYLRELNSGGWTGVNEDETYIPSSLLKIPVLMACLRESELRPGLLEKEIYVDKLPEMKNYSPAFPPSEVIRTGKKYTVRELIERMIIKSDNLATSVLQKNELFDISGKVEMLYANLGLPQTVISGSPTAYTVHDISKFIRMLYNATYISNEDADYALSILAKSEFREGMTKGLPPDVTVAHKFGENHYITEEGEVQEELMETGIIYFDNDPVLLTIMTKGKNMKQLSMVISGITKYIYDELNVVNSQPSALSNN